MNHKIVSTMEFAQLMRDPKSLMLSKTRLARMGVIHVTHKAPDFEHDWIRLIETFEEWMRK